MRARAGKRLQWGRAQMSAEISITAGWEVDKNGLQWGRAQMSAEIGPPMSAMLCRAILQWGRAQMAAAKVAIRFTGAFFNGAALR